MTVFLAAVPPGFLTGEIARMAPDLGSGLVVIAQRPLDAHVQLAGLRILGAVGEDQPHRLLALQGFPVGERIRDPRLTSARARTGTGTGTSAGPDAGAGSPSAQESLGPVPPGIAAIAGQACAELGLPALVLAGGDPGGSPWVLAQGWPDLDQAESQAGTHSKFPAAADIGDGAVSSYTVTADGATAARQGMSLDATATLLIRVRDHRTHVILTNRPMTIGSIDGCLRQAWTTREGGTA